MLRDGRQSQVNSEHSLSEMTFLLFVGSCYTFGGRAKLLLGVAHR
jgi:hypothetical protein